MYCSECHTFLTIGPCSPSSIKSDLHWACLKANHASDSTHNISHSQLHSPQSIQHSPLSFNITDTQLAPILQWNKNCLLLHDWLMKRKAGSIQTPLTGAWNSFWSHLQPLHLLRGRTAQWESWVRQPECHIYTDSKEWLYQNFCLNFFICKMG